MNDADKTIHIDPPKHIRFAAVAALSMLALFLLVETLNAFDNIGRSETPAMNTITVSGEGRITASPDIARISFTVMQDASTVAAAQEIVTEQMNDVLEYLEDEGIGEEDLKTTSYTVSPQYAYPNPCPPGTYCVTERTPKLIGYQVSHTVELTVRDLDMVGALLAGLGSRNVQNLYGPNFTLDDPDAVQNEARVEAIAEAKTEAKTLAKQLGVRLVRIVNFSEGSNYPIFYGKDAVYGTGGAESASIPGIPTGGNEYTSYVTITYEIR